MLTSPWPSSKIRMQRISPHQLAFKCAWMPVNSASIFLFFFFGHCLKTSQRIRGWLLSVLPDILNSPADFESLSWNSLLPRQPFTSAELPSFAASSLPLKVWLWSFIWGRGDWPPRGCPGQVLKHGRTCLSALNKTDSSLNWCAGSQKYATVSTVRFQTHCSFLCFWASTDRILAVVRNEEHLSLAQCLLPVQILVHP